MNIIGNLFKEKEKEEIVKWTFFDLGKLETKEEDIFANDERYVVGLKRVKIKRKKVRYKVLLDFVEDLKMSLESGMTILEALEISKDNTENIEIILRIEEIKQNLKRGESIGTAWRNSFPEEEVEIINLISLYEESGAISVGFEKIASYIREKIEFREKLFKTMYYPVFIFFFSVGVFIWFINYFIPSMLLMLKDVMFQADYINIHGIYRKIKMGVNGLVFSTTLFILYFIISKEGKKKILKKISFFSFFRKLINIYYLEVFSHYFYHLIKSGFSIIRSLDILREDESFSFCKKETESCIRIIMEGHPLSQGMGVYDFIGRKELWKIKKGETRGTLVESFYSIHAQVEKEKRFFFNEIISFAEPFMLLAAGVTVGLSVYFFYRILFSYTFTMI